MLSKPLNDSKMTQVSDHKEHTESQHINHNALFMIASQDHFEIEGAPPQMSLFHLVHNNEIYISLLNSIINHSFIADDSQGMSELIQVILVKVIDQLGLNHAVNEMSQSFISSANSLLIRLFELLKEYENESQSTDYSEGGDNEHI